MKSIYKMKQMLSIFMVLILVFSSMGLLPSQANADGPIKVVLAGDLQKALGATEDWDPTDLATEMVDTGNGNYQFTGDLPAGTYQYKVVADGSWLGFDRYTDPLGMNDGENIKIVLTEETKVTFYYNHITHKIADSTYYSPLKADKLPRVVGNLQTSMGDAGDWSPGDAQAMMYDDDFDNIYSVTKVVYAGDYEYKIVLGSVWGEEYPGSNAKLSLTEELPVTFNYNVIDHSVSADFVVPGGDIPANTVRIHYQRADNNYSPYGVWNWDDVATPSNSNSWASDATPFPADQIDQYGAYVDIPLQANAKKIGFFIVNRTLGDADKEDNRSFNLLDKYNQLWIKQGDPNVYVSSNGNLPIGLTSAEVLSESKILLGFTMTEGLDEAALKGALIITDQKGDLVTINRVQITSATAVEVVTTPFLLENVPLSVTYSGRTVYASTGWRMIDEMYHYEGDDLGATYHANTKSVTLKLWAPKASSVVADVYDKDDATQLMRSVDLTQEDKGVWSTTIVPSDLGITDLRGYFYQYEVINNGVAKQVLDPYAKSMAAFRVNTKGDVGSDGDAVGKAAIVDLSRTNPLGYDFANIEGYEQREDAIIWEIHVRDFTSDPLIENDLNNATWGSYDAFKNKVDYIKSLGVTHVQLLPVMAWYYGDEMNMKTRELDYSTKDNGYNWGYDPHNYFSPDGAYSENPADPELRIKELKNMIDAIHDAGMGVLLDVVYTHMAQASLLDDIVPNYYSFQDANGNNIGGFGNNLATNHKMSEKLMVDSVKYWFDEYKIDGMRWDMMGDATYDAVQNAYDAAEAINPNVLFIGEGWRTFGGAAADPSLAGQGADQDWMDKTDSVGVFSDEIRNELKSGFGSEGQPRFITGGARDINVIFNNIKAQPSNTTADDPGDIVPYIEAHDNLPLYDVIAQSIKKDPAIPANDLEIHKRIRLGNMLVLTSQGTAFLHAGQEYGRTKQWKGATTPTSPNEHKFTEFEDETGHVFGYFVHDSYDSSDAVNMFDWNKATDEVAFPVNNTTREYTAGLTELRKSTDAFRLGDQMLVDSNITLIEAPEIELEDLIIAYKNKATDGTGHYYAFVNADNAARTLTLSEDLTTGTVVVDNDEAGIVEVKSKSGFTLTANSITLEPLSAVIIKMEAAASVLSSVEVKESNYSLEIGRTHQTAVYARYDDGSQRAVTNKATYTSSNNLVATVTAKGLVKAVSKGTATITVTYGGITSEVTVTVTAQAAKRYVQINYIRPDKDYTDWGLWVWNTGVKNDQILFDKVENGVATVMIEISSQATSVGFVLIKDEDEAEELNWNKIKQDYPDDRIIWVTPGETLTKVNVTSMVREMDVLPSITGPILNDGHITFVYRDDALFQSGQMSSMTDVKVKIDGTEYTMTYDPAKEWFSYTLNNAGNGTHEYTFVVTKDGSVDEVTDPHNTMNGKSTVEYQLPVVTIKSAVNPSVMTANENAVLKLNVVSDQFIVYREGYINLTELGGPSKVKLDTEILEQSIAVKDSIAAGSKNIPITLVDQYGNKHLHSATVQVKARTYTGKDDFDWDEARIYFALTDRFQDGDTTNNFDVDTSHLEAYHGGDFRGLIDKLDYLQNLGINTLWITPIVDNIDFNKGVDFDSKQYGYHGYWAKDFTKIDEHLGDLETFKELIDTAHDKGIKIMVDVVLNHAGYGLKDEDNRPGITQEDKDRFADMLRTDGISAEEDPLKGELAGLPDFITEDADVRAQIIDWQAGWLDRARTDRGDTIDYFRVDTVTHVEDTTWKAFKNALTAIDPDFKLIGEYFGASVNSDGGTLQSGQMDSLLDFSFNENAANFVNGNIESAEVYLASREAQMDNTRTMGQFLSSHDEDGFLSSDTIGGDKGKLKAAAALQITSKGQPVIYYGEELGRSGRNAGTMSKGELSENRADMPWDQLESEKPLHDHYQNLLNIRAKYSKVFSKGTRTSLVASNEEGYLAFSKKYGSENVVTIINTKETSKDIVLSVPFVAGSQVKDEYSGKVYNVTNDQQVSLSLPGMNEGGTVILAIVPPIDNGDDTGNGSGSGGSSPSVGNGTSNKVTQRVINEDLLKSGKDKVVIDLGEKENGVLIPLKAAEILGSKKIEINKGDFRIELPATLLKAIQLLIPSGQSEGAVISFKMDEVEQSLAESLVGKSNSSTSKLKVASKMFNFSLSVQTKDGKEVKVESFVTPITLVFTVDPSADKRLLGVYFIKDNGELEHVTSYWEDGKLKADVYHFSKYAVIEYNKSFEDLIGHWAQEAVKELAAKHVVEGTSDSTFSPAQKLTRAQFATMLVRALNLTDEGNVATFKDVNNTSWYGSAVSAAYHHGLVNGKNEFTFAPQDRITREEMAVMIVRAYKLRNAESPVMNGSISAFMDEQLVSTWAKDGVETARLLGLMNGQSKNEFIPKADTSRAEGAQALVNLLNRIQ